MGLQQRGRDRERGSTPPPARSSGDPIPVGAKPRGLAAEDGSAWVANSGDGSVTRLRDGLEIQVGGNPRDLAIADGTVWVANAADDTVTRIDAESAEVVGDPIEVGDDPIGIAVGGDAVWVTGFRDDTLSRLPARLIGAQLQETELVCRNPLHAPSPVPGRRRQPSSSSPAARWRRRSRLPPARRGAVESCVKPSGVQRSRSRKSKYPNIRRHFRARAPPRLAGTLVVNRRGADARRDRLLERHPDARRLRPRRVPAGGRPRQGQRPRRGTQPARLEGRRALRPELGEPLARRDARGQAAALLQRHAVPLRLPLSLNPR